MTLLLVPAQVSPWRAAVPWIALLALVGSAGWAGWQVKHDPRFRVQKVVVEDATEREGAGYRPRHALEGEVRHLADVRMGQPLWDVELEQAVQGVLTHPWVRSAVATRRWPDTVVLRVEEYVPRMLLQSDGLYYVDERAEVFKRARTDDLDYPVLTGLAPELLERQGEVARRVVEEAIRVLDAVEASGEVLVEDVSEVHFQQRAGFTLVLRNGAELSLGFADPGDALRRLRRLRQAGLSPTPPQHIELAMEAVAVASPLGVRSSPPAVQQP